MSAEIEYIIQVVDLYDLGLTWLAKQLNKQPNKSRLWHKQHLDHMLSVQKEISTTTFREIKKYFDEHGFTLPSPQLQTIGDAVSELNKQSAYLVSTGFKALEDDYLSPDEIGDISAQLNNIGDNCARLKKFLEAKNG